MSFSFAALSSTDEAAVPAAGTAACCLLGLEIGAVFGKLGLVGDKLFFLGVQGLLLRADRRAGLRRVGGFFGFRQMQRDQRGGQSWGLIRNLLRGNNAEKCQAVDYAEQG